MLRLHRIAHCIVALAFGDDRGGPFGFRRLGLRKSRGLWGSGAMIVSNNAIRVRGVRRCRFVLAGKASPWKFLLTVVTTAGLGMASAQAELILRYSFDTDTLLSNNSVVQNLSSVGNTYDATGRNLSHAAVPFQLVTGKFGEALNSAAQYAYLTTFANTALNQSWSISFWAKANSLTLDNQYMWTRGGSSGAAVLYSYDVGNRMKFFNGTVNSIRDNQSAINNSLSTSDWTNIIYTWNGTTLVGYKNGTQVVTNSQYNYDWTSTSGTVSVGGPYNLSFLNFNGAIDEFRLYDHALTAAEVGGIQINAVPEPTTYGLVVASLVAGGLRLGGRRFGRKSSRPGCSEVAGVT
jgi:hypothetical protein